MSVFGGISEFVFFFACVKSRVFFFGILYEGMNKHTYLLLSTVSRDLPEDSREKKKLSRLQVNPHFIMAAQPVRGRLKNMF